MFFGYNYFKEDPNTYYQIDYNENKDIINLMNDIKIESLSNDYGFDYLIIPSKNMEGVILRALDIFSLTSVKKGRMLSDINVEIYNPDAALISIKDMLILLLYQILKDKNSLFSFKEY